SAPCTKAWSSGTGERWSDISVLFRCGGGPCPQQGVERVDRPAPRHVGRRLAVVEAADTLEREVAVDGAAEQPGRVHTLAGRQVVAVQDGVGERDERARRVGAC